MAKIQKEYHEALIRMNERLFEEENNLERLRMAVSAARHYLSAFPDDDERVFSLRGAICNYRAKEKEVGDLRKKLENEVNNVFYHIEEV